MKKNASVFTFSLIFSALSGLILWNFFEFIGSNEKFRNISCMASVLSYPLLYIALVGMPLGSIIGILFVDKILFAWRICNLRRILLCFLTVFLGMLVFSLVGLYVSIYDIPASLYFLRGDMFVFAMPFVAAILSCLSYSVRSKSK